MFALGYGVIPHEWLTFGNSYLNFDSASFLLHKNRHHSRSTSHATRSSTRSRYVIYVVVLVTNV